ncbi:MAG: hypothetical protein Q4E11_02125 [Corynebacterium sp.]|uniref:hypothetical protein n=1 Tax=Corynebacterium sp. TaxID=1720 RepID=UPI0026DD533F|nr:hypothetical protein [Corynebacterium sp.]MDO5029363.1 hypothetical protein [Corynebacterium sp.]
MLKSSRRLKTTLAVVFCMSAVGAAVAVDDHSGAVADARNSDTDSGPSISTVTPYAKDLPRMNVNGEGRIQTNPRTQMSVSYSPIGVGYSTDEDQRPLPALSLIKLYIGQYVLEHGAAADAKRVEKMVSRSDDDLAAEFYELYPESVDSIAAEYGLFSTFGGQKWGVSRTTAADVVSFISQLRLRDSDSVVLKAMRQWSPVAADGYRQDFGLAGLPGSEGAKMGWSNGRTWHSSVVFGPGYVMAAITEGSKLDHTKDVAEGIDGVEYQQLLKNSTKDDANSTKARAKNTGLKS